MLDLIEPDWPAPDNVGAFCTTRSGGVSEGVYGSLNLALHVGDAPGNVDQNRSLLAEILTPDTAVQWLDQVHGRNVVQAPTGTVPTGDAAWTNSPNVAVAVLTADCLPVLFCNHTGTLVAAAHAGWRGLVGGVLEATLAALPTPATELMAWLGPAIGPRAYEVGPEVREAFLVSMGPGTTFSGDEIATAFQPSRGKPGHYLADLGSLARQRLRAAGVASIYGGDHCTFSDSSRFFSYRRDGQTGRMASLIYLSQA